MAAFLGAQEKLKESPLWGMWLGVVGKNIHGFLHISSSQQEAGVPIQLNGWKRLLVKALGFALMQVAWNRQLQEPKYHRSFISRLKN